MRNLNQPRILLLNPPIYDFAAYDLWIRPLGLLYLSSFLKKAGAQVVLADTLDRHHPLMTALKRPDRKYNTGKYFSVHTETPEAVNFIHNPFRRYGMPSSLLKDLIFSQGPYDLIMITSMMTYWYPGAVETAELVRELYPDTPVLAGGTWVNLMPGHASKVLQGCRIVPDTRIRSIMNTVSEYTDLPALSNDPEFSDWPAPDYSGYTDLSSVSVTTSLGCPFSCSYCAAPVRMHGFIRKSPDRIIHEITEISSQTKCTDLAFYDDALLFQKEDHIIPILEKMIRKGIRLNLHTPNGLHAPEIDAPLARLMRKAGFRTLRVSLESQEKDFHSKTGKKLIPEDYVHAVSHLKNAGFEKKEIGTYVMAGRPGQTVQSVIQTLEFVRSVKASPNLTEYSIIPGSRDWNDWNKRFSLDTLDPLIHNNSVFPVYAETYTMEEWDLLREKIRKIRRDA